jgi:diguanylate cyclase (GGDEF)-like protein
MMSKKIDELEVLRLLSGMSRLFQGCPEESDILDVAWWYLPVIFNHYQGRLLLMDSLTGQQKPSVEWGGGLFRTLPDPEHCPGQRQGMTVMVDTQTCPGCLNPGERGCCSPILIRGESSGMLRLVEKESFDDEFAMSMDAFMGLVSVVAEDLAMAVDNLRMRKLLEKASLRDSLTGLYNRRYMEDFVLQTISRAKRNNQGFGLVLIDVDHFKKFNDQWGHVAGDKALGAIGKIFLDKLRDGDAPCRVGGEEFLMVLPDCSYEDALKKADDLRMEILKLELKSDSGQLLKVNVSGGVVAFPGHGYNFKELYEKADQALYKAKQAGRNRILGCHETDTAGE